LTTNLIFNAVDALPTGGTIRVRVAVEEGQGLVEVSDSGTGMSAEVQARAFEPFFTTKGTDGTGLGLAMVFGIVQQHEGHIEVRSAPGEGTTFCIRLPLVAEVEDAWLPNPAAEQVPTHSLRILVVDDEPVITRAVLRMLTPLGHTVAMAESGEEALAKLADQKFDVVVSDLLLGPGMTGWELADATKNRWPSVRFLLATGRGAAVDLIQAQTRRIDAVLAKPYRVDDVLRALAGTDIPQ
jgi:CheY-like chemotaxis protein